MTAMAIMGVVRNGGAALSQTLGVIEALRARVQHSRLILATNDNDDDTDAVLAHATRADTGAQVLRLDGLAAAMPDRVDRIAAARNMTLAGLRALPEAPPLVLMLDLDGPNATLDPDAVLEHAAQETPEWDALFANQHTAYYDLFALRHPQWCPRDVMQEVEDARWRCLKTISKRRLKARYIHARQYHIPADHPLIPVQSAFGGLGLYRSTALAGCWYGSRTAQGAQVCEHVMLHQQMTRRGARLFIAPGVANTAPPEHLGAKSGQPFPGFP